MERKKLIEPKPKKKTKLKRGPVQPLDDKKKRQAVIDYIKASNYTTTAVILAGVSLSSHYTWMRKGEKTNKLNPIKKTKEQEYYLQVEAAKGYWKAKALENIKQAGDGIKEVTVTVVEKEELRINPNTNKTEMVVIEKTTNTKTLIRKHWQADAWRLERMSPKEYGRLTRYSDETDSSPQQSAEQIREALKAMFATVPGKPEVEEPKKTPKKKLTRKKKKK